MTLIIFLYGLAIWRISYALTEEDGPGKSLKSFRESFDSDWSPLNCFYCTSVWVSFFFCLTIGLGFFYIFALSALAIFIHGIHEMIWER